MEGSKDISLSISKIFDMAQREKWVVEYDASLDSFYWTKPQISKDAKLKKFLDDFSLYINSQGQVEGVFIEYAKYNFATHNDSFEVLFKKLEKVDDDRYILPASEDKEAQSILRNMADRIGNETLEAIGKGLDLKEVVMV